jgi:hypothetical protein
MQGIPSFMHGEGRARCPQRAVITIWNCRGALGTASPTFVT